MGEIMSRPHFLFPALIVFGTVALASPGANAFQFDNQLAVNGQAVASAVVPVSSTTHRKVTARAKIKLQADESVPEYAVGATGGYNPCIQCPYGCSWANPKVCYK
jgi:hypothetical protein